MRHLRDMWPTVAAIVMALLVGAAITALSGHSVQEVFGELVRGAFGGRRELARTLTRATPVLFTSLSFLVAFRSGMFNIGAEGQMYMGAVAAAWGGFALSLPPYVHLALCLFLGALFGALWGFIPGWLKARRRANEFVVTMMLSYVAIYFTSWLVSPGGPFHGSQWANQTPRIARSAQLLRLMRGSQLSMGFLIGVLVALLVWYFLFRTPRGYELRVIGQNSDAAEYGGIDVGRGMMAAMALAGALAGLGGAVEVLGTHRYFIENFSPGYGWDGIAGGLIARAHPLGALLSSVLIGALRAGGMAIDRAGAAPSDLAAVLQGLVIFFVAAPYLFRILYRLCKSKRGKSHNADRF